MKNCLHTLLSFVALNLLAVVNASALVYTFNADVSNFDNQNVVSHTFHLGAISGILSVSIELSHTRAADIDFTLRAPTAQTFVLSTDNGGTSDLNGLYTFVSVSDPNGGNGSWTNLGATVTIPPGFYDAESWVGSSSGWSAGDWTLILTDDASTETGSVGQISVNYSVIPEPGMAWFLAVAACGFVALGRRR